MFKRTLLAVLLAAVAVSVAAAVSPGPSQTFAAAVSGNTVTFTWTPPLTGGVPSSYVVEAAVSPGGVAIASLGTATSPLVVPIVPNGVYYVAVRGVNADGLGQRSNEIVVVVPGGGSGGGCASPPNAPTSLTSGSFGNLVTLAWATPAGGCQATSYVIQAGSSPGASNIAVVNAGAATTLSASAPPGTYYIRVLALNTFGGSAASNEVVTAIASATVFPTTTTTIPIFTTTTIPRPTTTIPITRVRTGAVCRDGWPSTATGSGACSSHGGVSCWRYSDGSCTNP